ncbi:MAG: recombinase family protein [Patescibacteria group bacterium]|nr:recombinase family protein [Patescibacteria group bacterium]
MKKVAIYVRVSTQRQKDERTIESQLAVLKEICKDFEIVKEYIDNGWSGGTLARPSLDKLRDDAKEGLFEALYVHSADRLSRDHLNQLIVLKELEKRGIEVVFKDRVLTEENKLLTDIESLLAEHEKRQFIERSRRGKLHKVKNGKLIRSCATYGYRFIKNKKGDWQLKIEPEEAKIVKLIFNLYLEHQTITGTTKAFHLKKIRYGDNKIWRPQGIARVLKSETYIGNWYYNKTKSSEPKNKRVKFNRKVKSSKVNNNRKDWLMVKVPAIIDRETFDKVQELRKKNFKLYGKTKNTYLLSGLMRCEKCGSRMVGICHHNKYSYYVCSSKPKSFPEVFKCNSRMIKKEFIEDYIWGKIKEALQNPKILIKYIFRLKEGDKEKQSLGDLKQDLLKHQAITKKKKSEVWRLWDKDFISIEEFEAKIENYTLIEREIKKDLKGIEVRLSQATSKQDIINSLKEFASLTKVQLNILKPEQIKKLLKSIVKTITYNSDTGRIMITGYISISKLSTKRKEELMKLPIPTFDYASILVK